jgi:hypothetical protein
MAKVKGAGLRLGKAVPGVKPANNFMGSQPKLSAKIGGVTNAVKNGRSYPKGK